MTVTRTLAEVEDLAFRAPVASDTGEASADEADVSDGDPGLGALDGFLEVLGETPAAPEPSEGTLDDPASGENLEAFGAVGALDDFQGPFSDLLQGPLELRAGVSGVGEDMAQPREGIADGLEHRRRAVAILDIDAMDERADQQTQRIGDDMALELRSLLRSP